MSQSLCELCFMTSTSKFRIPKMIRCQKASNAVNENYTSSLIQLLLTKNQTVTMIQYLNSTPYNAWEPSHNR